VGGRLPEEAGQGRDFKLVFEKELEGLTVDRMERTTTYSGG
jgi:hypothetical protein